MIPLAKISGSWMWGGMSGFSVGDDFADF